jgi:hypothetical protein
MLQLKNLSPFAVHMAVFPDAAGVDTAYATVKATFVMGSIIAPAAEQIGVRLADEFWGDPATSSLKYASEVHPSKPGTDIVLVGQAWAPQGKPATRVDVRVHVAGLDWRVRVTGDREWRPGFLVLPSGITPPKPFKSLPLTFERAFGGTLVEPRKKDQVRMEPRNPVGRGFAGGRRGRSLTGLPLPNLEDPAKLVRSPRHHPKPMAPGYVAASWEPRKSFAGTYDAAWQRERAPYLPRDFDPAFFNAAHPDLVSKRFLTGGERVELENVSPRGAIQFELPRAQVKVSVRLGGQVHTPPVNLETVLIEPDDSRFTILWRAALSCDKKALRVEEVEIQLGELKAG